MTSSTFSKRSMHTCGLPKMQGTHCLHTFVHLLSCEFKAHVHVTVRYVKMTDEIKEATKTLVEKEDKLLVAEKKAEAEAKERETKLDAARNKLKRARYL